MCTIWGVSGWTNGRRKRPRTDNDCYRGFWYSAFAHQHIRIYDLVDRTQSRAQCALSLIHPLPRPHVLIYGLLLWTPCLSPSLYGVVSETRLFRCPRMPINRFMRCGLTPSWTHSLTQWGIHSRIHSFPHARTLSWNFKGINAIEFKESCRENVTTQDQTHKAQTHPRTHARTNEPYGHPGSHTVTDDCADQCQRNRQGVQYVTDRFFSHP